MLYPCEERRRERERARKMIVAENVEDDRQKAYENLCDDKMY